MFRLSRRTSAGPCTSQENPSCWRSPLLELATITGSFSCSRSVPIIEYSGIIRIIFRHHFFHFRQLLKFSGESGPVIRIDFKYLFMSTFAHHRAINRKVSTFRMSSDSEHSICMFRDFLQILYGSFLCRNYTCAEIKIFFPSYDRIIRSAKET